MTNTRLTFKWDRTSPTQDSQVKIVQDGIKYNETPTTPRAAGKKEYMSYLR